MADQWDSFYQDAGKQYPDIDPDLLRAIVKVESGGNANAKSSAGAIGPAQLLPQTASNLGVEDPTDPRQAIFGAAKLLDQNMVRYGNIDDAVKAYHGGTNQENWGPKTVAYHQKVMAAYGKNSDGADVDPRFAKYAQEAAPAIDPRFAQYAAQTAPATQAATQPTAIPLSESVPMGIARGAADVGNTLLNAMDVPAQYLENKFGTLGGPSVIDARSVRDTALKQYESNYGNSTPALLGRIAGSTALTVPVILGGMGAIESAPVVGGALNVARGAGLIGRVGVNALTGSGQGAAAAGLTSGGYDQPIGQQVASGAIFGGALSGAAPIVQKGAGAAYGALTGASSVNPLTQALARQAVNDFGIPMRGSQITSSPFIKFLDSTISRLPFSGMSDSNEAIAGSFNRAVSNTIGLDTENLTPQMIQQAKKTIGQKFETVANNVSNIADQKLGTDLVALKQSIPMSMTDAEASPLLKNIDQIFEMIGKKSGNISGQDYQSLVKNNSTLDKLIDSDNSTISGAASQIKDTLDGALTRNAPQHLQDLLSDAKYQWKNYITLKPLLAKATADGQISPALLRNRVQQVWGNLDTGGGGDLGALSRIGQQFLKEPSSSGSAERIGIMQFLKGAGTAGAGVLGAENPHLIWPLIGSAAGSLFAARLGGSVLRSDAYRNALLNAGLPQSTSTINPLLRAGIVPAAIGFDRPQQALPFPLMTNANQNIGN